MVGISRQPGESIKDYTVRLCRNREQYGLKWDDVAALINKETGDDYGESRYRKWFSAWSEGYEDGLRERLDDDPLIQEYEDKRIEMQKERVRLADQRRIYNQLIRDQGRFEYIVELLSAELNKLAKEKPIDWTYQGSSKTKQRHGVLLLSDIHYGLKVDSYFNRYNPDIARQRFVKLLHDVIEYGTEQGIEVLHIKSLGDQVAGNIHISTRVHATESVVQQTQHVAELMSEFVAKVSEHFPTVKFYSTIGNHGRCVPQKDAQREGENFEYFIPWFMSERLRHIPNVEFMQNVYDPDIIVADVLGHRIVGIHGDKDSPSNVAQNLSLMLGEVPTAFVCAHYHHNWEKEQTGGIDVIVNPSFCGADQYSIEKRKTSKPAQKLLIYNEAGRICTYNILLQ
jgi:hypothetical protein